jgi:methionine synthase I (cobalamin-dependent)
MTDRPTLAEALARGPIVLDAAMGTRLIGQGLDPLHDDPALWNLSHPECVATIHEADVAAGAGALLTNTFGANRSWFDRFGRGALAAASSRRAVALARGAAGPGRFVIASIGPTAGRDPSALAEQVETLLAEGADALLFETHTPSEALRTLGLLGASLPVPRIVSLVQWLEPAADLVRRLEDLRAAVVGGNCQPGMAQALALAERLAGLTRLPLLMKPSAGLPGEPSSTPREFADAVPALLSHGVRMVGGCCGTTDAHVAALRAACYDSSARSAGTREGSLP